MRLRHDTQLTKSEISPPLIVEIEAFTKNHIRSIGAIVQQAGVCHTVALPFTLKEYLMVKENYGNSNISSCKNIIFRKIL
jgi:hypothetical protein